MIFFLALSDTGGPTSAAHAAPRTASRNSAPVLQTIDTNANTNSNSTAPAVENGNGSSSSPISKTAGAATAKKQSEARDTPFHNDLPSRRLSDNSSALASPTSSLLLSFHDPSRHSDKSTNGPAIKPISPVRPSLGRRLTVDIEPKSLSYLHKKRFSDLASNPFFIQQGRQNQTSNNTELNKLLSLNESSARSSIDDGAASDTASASSAPSTAGRSDILDNSNGRALFNNGATVNNGSFTSVTEGSKSLSPRNNTSDTASNGSRRGSDLQPLVRKKTGEIVKSSLKLSSLGQNYGRSAQSLPTTPTYKSVHFNNDSFADVKYFREKDTPTAISAETSPVVRPRDKKSIPKYRWLIGDSDSDSDNDNNDTDTDDSASGTDNDDFTLDEYEANIDWELELKNFKPISYSDKLSVEPPVFLERFFLSTDKRFLKGHIAAKNLAFEKSITIKYSLNNWKIISEINAEYVPDIPRMLRKHHYDRFIFKIPLIALIEDRLVKDHINIVSCIKYESAGKQFWDNNDFKNYEIRLRNTKLKSASARLKKNAQNYSNRYLKKQSSANGLKKLSSYDSDDYSDASANDDHHYDYDDHQISDIYNRYSDNKDSYFPPFESLSPSTPNFKYPSYGTVPSKSKSSSSQNGTAANGDEYDEDTGMIKAPTFNDLGELAVDFNYGGLGTFYSSGPSLKTAENLAFDNQNTTAADSTRLSSRNSDSIDPREKVSPVSLFSQSEQDRDYNDNKNGKSNTFGTIHGDSKHPSALSPGNVLHNDENRDSKKSGKSASQTPQQISQKLQAQKPQQNGNLSSPSVSPKHEIQKLRNERPSIDSKSYQELVQNYCFFQG